MAVFQEQEYNKPFDFKVWKKMLPFLRPYYVNLCIVIVLNIVMALIDISMPLFQRYTIDHYIGGGTLEAVSYTHLVPIYISSSQSRHPCCTPYSIP